MDEVLGTHRSSGFRPWESRESSPHTPRPSAGRSFSADASRTCSAAAGCSPSACWPSQRPHWPARWPYHRRSSSCPEGLSAALLAPAALSLLTTTFTEGPERNRALAFFGAATAVGFVAGQILGGVLTDVAGLRSIFVINVPVGILAAVASRVIPADHGTPARRVPDVAGAVLITSAMALAVWAPTQGAEHGWASASFLAPMVAALVLTAVFITLESRRADPLIRLPMLRSAWMVGTSSATAITGALNGAVVLLCTLFLQHVHGYSPLQAGFAFVPTGAWPPGGGDPPGRAAGHPLRRTHRADRSVPAT